jgi:D-3-phosphoglycerate dehydrogenase
MPSLKVVVTDHVFESFAAEEEILAAVGAELQVLQCKSAAEVLPHLSGVHGLLNTYLPGMDAQVFDAAPELKAIVRYGIGLDTIDIPAATARGIIVANVPDYCIDEVADHALAHFLNLARKISPADRRVRAGEWSLSYVKPLKAIRTMRAGIIGFGRIGRAIAERLAPFRLEVVFYDPVLSGEIAGARRVCLEELWGTCDAIFVQCPATPETRHLLGREAFERMKQQPVVINCARGEIVDTDALVWALENGKVSGAGLDLLEDEDAVVKHDHPLKGFDNVALTPHSAWFSDVAIPNLQRRAAEEMARALSGQRPTSLINPEVLGPVEAG